LFDQLIALWICEAIKVCPKEGVPKSTSNNYTSQINRDSIVVKVKSASNFRAPKLVSLDEDWSGFSFKHWGKK